MKGDYLRYIAEYAAEPEKNNAATKAEEAYEMAHGLGEKSEDLPSTHPLRLGLALNFSVYFYEIKQNPKKACEMARNAFDSAIADLDEIDDDFYKDATLIM